MNVIKKTICLFIGCSLLAASSGFTASENLDELAARKARLATATWDKSFLENTSTLVWQPETLQYTDILTGSEVWRMSTTKGLRNSLPDLGWSHYSADGKRFSFGSNRDTSAGNCSNETDTNASWQGTVMMMRSDGSYLRPANNAPFEVYSQRRYLQWDMTRPDVYYGIGNNNCGEGLSTSDLYKVTVGDTSISKTKVLTLPTAGNTMERGTSPDGSKLMILGAGTVYIASISKGGGDTVALDDANGWAMARPYDQSKYWLGDSTLATDTGPHFIGLIGPSGSHQKIYHQQAAAYWQWGLSGAAADGGPLYVQDYTPPFDTGSIVPIMAGMDNGTTCNTSARVPSCCDNNPATDCLRMMSHPTFDRWGSYFIGNNQFYHRAFATWDIWSQTYLNDNISVPSYDWHFNGDAWSDYFAASPSSVLSESQGGKVISVKLDGSVIRQVATPHIRESAIPGVQDYNALPRVTTSPDGTKLVFHSDFLTSAGNWDVFYATAYYPHPPEITSVAGSGTYTIRFDWRTTQAGASRGYTQRGWPNEATNDPPPPRETKHFRLWRSSTGTGNWEFVSTVDAEIFSRYDFATGAWKGNNYWEFTDTPGTGTWYYAVTAMEHSGLESRTLSNVFSTAGTQSAAYPSDPKGVKKFYTVAPQWPELTITQLNTPGQYRLDWKEPDNPLIRYYNIYYSNISTAKAIQNQRIASVPKGTITYVDWLADPAKTGYYLITSVDTQGNESGFALRGGIKATQN